jgi:hypothetical protein
MHPEWVLLGCEGCTECRRALSSVADGPPYTSRMVTLRHTEVESTGESEAVGHEPFPREIKVGDEEIGRAPRDKRQHTTSIVGGSSHSTEVANPLTSDRLVDGSEGKCPGPGPGPNPDPDPDPAPAPDPALALALALALAPAPDENHLHA